MLDTLHEVFRGLHIIVGAIGLLLFWVPVCTNKGSRLHRAAGRWFVRSVYVVAGSGLISSAWAIASPLSFLGATSLPASLTDDLRFFYSLLALLSVLALQGAVLGTRVLQVKDRLEPVGNLLLRFVLSVQVFGSLALFVYSAVSLWTTGFQSRYYVPLVLAVLALLDYFEQRRFIMQPQPRGEWLSKHLECMIGCGIAFYTAASVTFFGRVLQLDLSGPLTLVPWLLPAAIGVPAIALAKRFYRRRLSNPPAAVVEVASRPSSTASRSAS